MKYPRTYHLPLSPGTTSDDKRLSSDWFEKYKGREVVFTEKLDGENTMMNCQDVYARSHSAPTRSPWSRNLWDSSEGLYWKLKPYIGEKEELFGENLYGEHSIHYDNLKSYWHLFAINDGSRWYSWDEIKEFASLLNIPTVPDLCRGVVNNESEVYDIIDNLMKYGSTYGQTKEGIVMRLTDSFDIDSFPEAVCKWVRANHVQTDEHWTKNWKKATLIQNYEN
jgi:hypothetical protein